MKQSLVLFLSVILLSSCHTAKQVPDASAAPVQDGGGAAAISVVESAPSVSVASPMAVVYKMKKDYSQCVPVILSDDKKTIVSYPHPRDVYTNGKLALPTPLNNGYWLDNRGISENVAFLSYTYEEYAAMQNVPSVDVLYKKIVDKDPITEMWFCGRRHTYHDIVGELNEIISNNKLEENFKKVK